MKLVSLTIENYRSITKAHRLKLGDSTILVGPNNEGKSNTLRALVTAMQVLTRGRRSLYRNGKLEDRFAAYQYYEWERDFPVEQLATNPEGKSVITLEFLLTQDEVTAFREAVGSQLNGTLPLSVELGPGTRCNVKVTKQGIGAKSLSAKSGQIARFLASRINFEYIPAVRTAERAQRVVDELVAKELASIEEDEEYVQALNAISKLQEPILQRVSDNIRSTLVKFLPAVKDVQVRVAAEERSRGLRSCEVIVDDGSPTHLRYKGDGVQSLAALGLMRHASETAASGRNLIIAIEEPESHLHPKAIHELKEVLLDLANKHQVVVTTHCPLFIDRDNISSNIIVSDRKAKPAKNIDEIREVLGVRAADNLRHAEIVLLVEGEEDRVGLEPILSTRSNVLKKALASGTLALDTLGGGSNLSYKIGLIRDALCKPFCFLDDDKSGRNGFEQARSQNLIGQADVIFSRVQGLPEAEIEDLYEVSVYENDILADYGVSLKDGKFKSKKKWSDRMAETFLHQGKIWDSRVEIEVKSKVASRVAASALSAVNKHKSGVIDSLIKTLETRIGALSSVSKA